MAVVDVGIVGQHVAGRRRIACKRGVERIDAGLGHDIARVGVSSRHGRIVGAGDGDGEVCGRGGVELVGHRVAEHVGHHGVLRQRLGVGIAVVQCVGVAAVGGDRDRAIGAGHRHADIEGNPCHLSHGQKMVDVDIGVVGQHVAGRRRITWKRGVGRIYAGLDYRIARVGVGVRYRRVVAAGDGYCEGRTCNAPMSVIDGGDVAERQRLTLCKKIEAVVGEFIAPGHRAVIGVGTQ